MKVHIEIEKISIQHPVDIYEIMQLVLKREDKMGRDKEHFWVLAMSRGNKILNLELVGLGSNNRVGARPADILAVPLQKQAAGVILVHNHPSARLEPSEADKDFTDRMIQACRLVETPVLDHVIISEHSYMSFKESGLLERLEMSNKYVLPYDLERQYHAEMEAEIKKIQKENRKKIKETLEKGIQKGVKEGRTEIARQMLLKGLDIKLICDTTGLSEAQIKALTKEGEA